MKQFSLETVEKQSSQGSEPILIIDKEGFIGEKLSQKLSPHAFVIFASKKKTEKENEHLLYVWYGKKYPQIPQAQYSHIFVIFENDNEIKETLPSFVKEAKKNKAKLIFIVSKKTTLGKFIEREISPYNSSTILLFFGDLFSEDPIPTHLDILLQEAAINRQITVSNMGLEELYPLSLEDCIEAILETSFGLSKRHGTYYLYQKTPTTLLSLFHSIQKKDPLIRVDFKEKPLKEEKIDLPKGVYLFQEEYPLQEKIVSTFKTKSDSIAGGIKHILKPKTESAPLSFLHLTISTLILIFFLPIFLTAFFSLVGVFNMALSKQALTKGDVSSALAFSNRGAFSFSFSRRLLVPVSFETSFVGLKTSVVFFDRSLEDAEQLSLTISSLSSSIISYKKVLTGLSKNPVEDSAKGLQELKQTLLSYEALKANGFLGIEQKDIAKFNFFGNLLINTVDAIPILLSTQVNKTYLVLFQNNMELRPAGGFIGSYGVLKIQKGRVADFSIHDVYDADGQLKGHIEPPYPIRRYIPMVHWYLRDSNFDVDFAKSAQDTAFFLKEETGETVDGVMAVDVTFIKYLLQALGPIPLSDYNETVTAQNLYVLTQRHAEKNFFPGSSQKKDFLRSLFVALENKLTNGKNISYEKLMNVLEQSIEEKHLLVAVSEQSTQNLFTVNKLSSSLLQNQTGKQNEIEDFLGINEANLGTNKANFFLKRKINDAVFVGKDKITSKVALSYFNASNGWPGGDYKMYLRFILPSGSALSSVSINGEVQKIVPAVTDFLLYEKKDFIPPPGLEADQYEEEGKSVFGFLTVVPSNAVKNITVEYTFPNPSLKDSFSYSLSVFKQPGTEEYPFELSLSYDSSINSFSIPPGFVKKGNTIKAGTILRTDEQYLFDFSKTN